MAPTTCVVLMQRVPRVEPEQPTEIGQLWIDGPAEIFLQARLKCLLDLSCEPGSRKHRRQLSVECSGGLLRREYRRDESRRTERQREHDRLSCTCHVGLPPCLTKSRPPCNSVVDRTTERSACVDVESREDLGSVAKENRAISAV